MTLTLILCVLYILSIGYAIWTACFCYDSMKTVLTPLAFFQVGDVMRRRGEHYEVVEVNGISVYFRKVGFLTDDADTISFHNCGEEEEELVIQQENYSRRQKRGSYHCVK